ncbi:hypothetical protein [Abyssibius alkaniclasticus]|uniref:hypothetical protein n=1 Tax=Abyssibius alkaniclasticus TaxID=2881234 RepID=UPI0040582D0F
MQLFFHALAQLIRNFWMAIVVSWMLPAALVAMNFAVLPQLNGAPGYDTLIVVFGLAVFYLVMTVHVAVAWHRNIFLADEARSDKTGEGAYLRYFLWSVLLGLIGILITAAIFVPLIYMILNTSDQSLWQLVGNNLGMSAGVYVIVVALLATIPSFVTTRLALVLPASTIKYPVYPLKSWVLTRQIRMPIFLCSFLLVGGLTASNIYFGLLPTTPYTVVAESLVAWFVTMLGISILTVMFEVCVAPEPAEE